VYKHFLYLILAIVTIAFASCKKDPIIPEQSAACDTTYHKTYTADTIYPSQYLMAYPGSWWEYDNGDRVDCVEWEYMPIYKQLKNEVDCPLIKSTYAYYPRLTGPSSKYISGNSALIISDHPYNTRTSPIIVGPGETLSYAGTSTSDYSTQVTKEIHESFDSLAINGMLFYDVINIRTQYQRSYSELAGGGPLDATHAYYAKGVGLLQIVFYINTDETDSGTPDIHKSITDFYIAPH
jgi:hypothetical protein